MARPAFKSEKRKKELQRLKKQEEKRQKRFNKSAGPSGEVVLDEYGNVVEPAEATTEDAPEADIEKPATPAQ